MDEVWIVTAGTVPYEEALAAQGRIEAARAAGDVPDVLVLLEHPPVYTKGRRSTAEELPMGEDWYRMQGIDVRETNRGGRVTYHGPGQLVGYPIVDLHAMGDDVHLFVRRMEEAVIGSLAEWSVAAEPVEGLTGIWTPERRKIGSIGVHVHRGVTTHGFAVNVSNDLQPFEWIVPCGIEGCKVTSLSRELGSAQDLTAFATTVAASFAGVYEREAVEIEAEALTARVEGVGALNSQTAALR